MFEWLFREYPSGVDIIPNNSTVALHIVGGGLIAVTFFAIGLICFIMAGYNRDGASRRRIILTKMFGMFLMSCASARLVEILCFFHNYANINGIIKMMTGIIALIALIYIPSVIKESLHSSSVSKVGEELKKVSNDIEEVKKISRNL